MSTTPTTNYGWLKPDVGTEADTWGGIQNTTIDDIDAAVKASETTADAALPIDGSKPMEGELILKATTPPTTDDSAANKKYVDDADTLLLPVNGSRGMGAPLNISANVARVTLDDKDSTFTMDGVRPTAALSFSGTAIKLKVSDAAYTEIQSAMTINLSDATTSPAVPAGVETTVFNLRSGQTARFNYEDATDLPTDGSIITRVRGDARYDAKYQPIDATQPRVIGWATINGGGAVVNGYNLTCTHVADSGLYVIEFTTNAPATSYSVQLSVESSAPYFIRLADGTKGAAGFSVQTDSTGGTPSDPTQLYVQVII